MKISVILPVHNEEEGILDFLQEFDKLVISQKRSFKWQVILVNDGSRDLTLQKVSMFSPISITIISLTKNFGHQAAIQAGYHYASGDYVLTLDADFQHPLKEALQMVHVAIEGNHDVVQGVRVVRKSEPFFKRILSRGSYLILDLFGITSKANSGDFRVVSTRVLEILKQLPTSSNSFRFMLPELGFSIKHFEFFGEKRKYGKSKYKFSHSLKLFNSGLLQYSKMPLTMMLILGTTGLFTSILYGLFILNQIRMGKSLEPGWLSLIFIQIFFFTIQFLATAIIGYYNSLLIRMIRRQPDFVVDEITQISPKRN